MTLKAGNAAKSSREDSLGRDGWVQNLAQCIKNYTGGPSLTIAVYGKWGSGKSTLLNFVIEELEKPDSQSLLVIGRFNPWNFSQQDKLYSSFFATLSQLVKRADDWGRVKKAAELLDALSVLSAPIALVPGWGSLVPQGIKKLSGLAKNYAAVLGDIEHIKESISNTLKHSKKRLVIVIDDIDRLTDGEIRQVFQLVKSVADFENVIYLLAFDHETVAKALDEVTGNQGDAYLEKITNVVLNVPPLTERQIRKLVYDELKPYAERQREYNWDTERFRDVLEVAHRNFRTMRQIYRFVNALTATERLTATDIDFTDHVALTLLQTFEPRLYGFIGAHPELFVDDLTNQFARPDRQDEADKLTINNHIDSLNGMTSEDARELLGAVFPKIKQLYSSRSFSSGSREWGLSEWRIAGRACASFRSLSRYFVFQVDDGDISAAEKDTLWQAAGSVETFEAYLRGLEGLEKAFSAFEYLKDIETSTLSDEQVGVIVTAIVDIGDEFLSLPGLDDVFRGPFNEASIALKVLLQSRSEAERFALALAAMQRPSRSVEMPSELAFVFTRPAYNVFTASQRPALVAACHELMKAAFLDGRLVSHRRFLALLPEWLTIGAGVRNQDAIQTIRTTLATDDSRFLELLGRYERFQMKHFEADRFFTKVLVEIYTLEELRERLTSIAEKPEFESERVRIAALLTELDKVIAERDREPVEELLPEPIAELDSTLPIVEG
jgi:predicted KAP-like P-loop ATPase